MVGVLGSDDAASGLCANGHEIRFRRKGRLLDETPDTGGGKMETCHGQDVRDFPFAQGGTQYLELLDDGADVFGSLVDRVRDLEQRFIVSSGSLDPTGNGVRLEQEGSAGFGEVPCPSGLEFEDGHSLFGKVMGPVSGADFRHAAVLDADLFPKHGVFSAKLVGLSSQTHPFDSAVDGIASGGCNRPMSQGDGFDDGPFDGRRPMSGQGNVLERTRSFHKEP